MWDGSLLDTHYKVIQSQALTTCIQLLSQFSRLWKTEKTARDFGFKSVSATCIKRTVRTIFTYWLYWLTHPEGIEPHIQDKYQGRNSQGSHACIEITCSIAKIEISIWLRISWLLQQPCIASTGRYFPGLAIQRGISHYNFEREFVKGYTKVPLLLQKYSWFVVLLFFMAPNEWNATNFSNS